MAAGGGISDVERKTVEDNLLKIFKKNKLDISKAVNTPSPFLEMLRDHSVISEQMYQCAQKKYQKMVPMYKGSTCTYSILKQLEKQFSSKILAALFHPTNLEEYPQLVQIEKQFRDVPLDESTSEASVGSPVQRSSLDEGASTVSTPQSSVQDASNNNKPSKVKKRRNCGVTPRVHRVTKKVSRKAKGPKMNYNLPELPVTCGKAKGTLHKEKMKNGSSEKCIEKADGSWLTLREFEIEGGREPTKNWKMSIRCGGQTLHYLIQKKFLPCPPRRYGRSKKVFPVGQTRRLQKVQKRTPECQTPPARNASQLQPKRRFFPRKKVPGKTRWRWSQLPGRRQVVSLADRPKYRAQLQAREWIHVACRMGIGRLYKNRFASVYKGKCILTEAGWYTPLEFLAKDPEIDITTWTHSIRSGGLTLQTLIENDILKPHTSDCSCVICNEEDPFPENNDECFICMDVGELFCCDSCPKSFHRDCHIPSVSTESAEWNCTFCIIRKNKEKEGPENNRCQQEFEVLKKRVYPEQQLKCEFLLMRMYCCSESFLFTKDPCRYKEYSQRVREPMWLDQVKERLSDETYNTVEGFVLDMRLIFYNCKKFNKDNQFGHLGAKLEAKFERDFKEVFDIKEADEVAQPMSP
ncbi:nuclear body protein SP140-like protein isoform X1 [Vombatus ursinus]|uniref:nuclear body protein SP140-like protein isoform X1 n=1 Tax=Vombatus ursinus TaxID=29139 RepID=UPI000FFDB106|nr:nuclear body protein SP140-like protein isoform X1 [Vombatus ursinus]